MRLPPILAALALSNSGCSAGLDAEADEPAPMEDGTWHISVDGVTSNTCRSVGISDEDLAGGGADTVELRIDRDGAGFTATIDGNQATYELDGENFFREFDYTTQYADSCYFRVDGSRNGTFTSPTYATATLEESASTEGDCSRFDMSGLPCSYAVEEFWEYIGD